jgi:phospholipid/cholesterol/gamma-HCH transport system permease protein
MAHHVKIEHILEGVYKSMSFGVIITWICCYKGYYAGAEGSGQAGVSKATTQGVVLASVMVLIWDYFMTAILF